MNAEKTIRVASRNSPLSHAQVQEVLHELRLHYPEIAFECIHVHSRGDMDKKTSLRTLGKSDFFTREVDEMVLSGACRIAIHSAKDLPDPLSKGLCRIALTRGVDSGDSLVLREGDSLASLPSLAKIATSSERREETVKQLRSDLEFVDIRGIIDERLHKLYTKEVDGVVIAEAALIRLGYTHLNRVRLPGPTTPLQGQLAIIAQEFDKEMAEIFSPLNVKRVLYLGPEIPLQVPPHAMAIHCPMIKIIPRPPLSEDIQACFAALLDYTHLIFTSKNAVRIFCEYLGFFEIQKKSILSKTIIAIGTGTANELEKFALNAKVIASCETAEGVVEVIKNEPMESSYFWPHASEARTIITDFFKEKSLPYRECILYDTVTQKPAELPDLSTIDEICFTSPSTIRAFLDIFGSIPTNKIISTWGPITKKYLMGLNSA